MANPRATFERQLGEVWRILQKEATGLGCLLHPKQPADAFTVSQAQDGRIVSEFKPLCMRVTEKAAKSRANLYVAIDGCLVLSQELKTPMVVTQKASAAYFRAIDGEERLKHVFAMHYDHLDTDGFNEFGHPTLHAQVKADVGKFSVINCRFHTSYEPIEDHNNAMIGILSNTRLPSAAMDPLCVILQVLGDHVVNVASNERNKESFRRSREAVARIRSDLGHSAVLNDAVELKCFRSPHWYPV